MCPLVSIYVFNSWGLDERWTPWQEVDSSSCGTFNIQSFQIQQNSQEYNQTHTLHRPMRTSPDTSNFHMSGLLNLQNNSQIPTDSYKILRWWPTLTFGKWKIPRKNKDHPTYWTNWQISLLLFDQHELFIPFVDFLWTFWGGGNPASLVNCWNVSS